MIPFARIVQYGNIAPGIEGRYEIYSTSQSFFLLDTRTNRLYGSSYDTGGTGVGTGKAEPKFVFVASNVKRLLLKDNSSGMQIYESTDGKAYVCGTVTSYTGVGADAIKSWTDCTTWFTSVGLVVSEIAYISGWYNLKLNVIMSNGDLWCSGRNDVTSLSSFGNGTNVNSYNKFIKITNIGQLVKATGNAYLRSDNTLWVCGINTNYQLGNGTNVASTTLKLLAENVVDSNVGYQNTYYISSDKTLRGCGTQFGQQYGNEFGTGGTSSSATVLRYTTPTVMMNNVDKLYVCVGNMATHAAQYSTKTVFSTGNNALAQLGVGDRTPVYVYQQSFSDFDENTDLVRNNIGSLILTKSGKLYYSGRNDSVMGGTTLSFTVNFTEVDMSFIQ